MSKRLANSPPAGDRNLAETSYIIDEEQILQRYSALFQALQARDDEAAADSEPPPPAPKPTPDFWRDILGRDPDEEKYVVRQTFTHGGMGALYYVDDRDFRRRCVMKVMMPEMRANAELIRSFVREARITGQLEHPHIIPVHDLGVHAQHGLYFTMKLIGGQSLNSILLQLESGNHDYLASYDIGALLSIFRKICDAVSFAHSRGIIHRDIKPSNIMVGDHGEVYLMDWGLARKLPGHDPDADTGTVTHYELPGRTIKGSPGYMSPEQATGSPTALDVRSDIFLLGATLYNLVTWYPPFMGTDVPDILAQARACDYLPPEALAPADTHVPQDLFRIIRRAMAADPADRYASVGELVHDLDDLIHGRMRFASRTYNPGEYLVREGETGHESYIIQSGKAEVFKHHGDHRVRLTTLGAGEMVGEMSLITHTPRSASVQALITTHVLVITEDRFSNNLQKLPPWMETMLNTLARRLADADERLTELLDRPEP